MTGTGEGLACLGVKLAAAGFLETFTRDEEHFDGNAAYGSGYKNYGEKKYLHVSNVFFQLLI